MTQQKARVVTAITRVRRSVQRSTRTILAEARLAAPAASRVARDVGFVTVWSVTAIIMGFVIGIAAVLLPPTGAFGIVGFATLVLLWVMPELPAISDDVIRRLFYIMIVVDLCVPNYYAASISGLPWISIRRIFTFALVAVFAIALSSSASIRRRVSERLGNSRWVAICAIGFLTMCGLSVFTSISPPGSLSQMAEVLLNWYVPFIAIIYTVRDEKDVLILARILGICVLFVALAGAVEFVVQKRFFIAALPAPVLAMMEAGNPNFVDFVNSSPYRNGVWRSTSIFGSPLSLGEFGGMVAPLGFFFLVYGRRFASRAFGLTIALACLIAVAASGSRGGYLSFIVVSIVFTAIWLVRESRFNRGNLAIAFVGLVAVLGFSFLIATIVFWPKAHNIVIGGGKEQMSTESRWEQLYLAWPKIVSNPITGHGLGHGADIIGYYSQGGVFPSVDSYVLALAAETGVPSVVFFFGMIIGSAWIGIRSYLSNTGRLGALAGCLGCCIIGFGTYRFFLAERENHTLFFVLVGCIVVLAQVEAQAKRAAANRPIEASYERTRQAGFGGIARRPTPVS